MQLYCSRSAINKLSILTLSVVTLMSSFFPGSVYAETDQPLIHVTAEGKATAQPDQVELNLDFIAKNFKVDLARKEVDDKVKALLKKLSKYELDTGSLDSSQTQIYPQYDYRNNQRQFMGYQVSRQISFILNNLEQLEELIETITSNDVSQLNRIQFGLSDSQFIKAEALANAIRNSRHVAQQLAEGYDVQLGTLHRVNHRTTQDRPALRAMPMQAEMASKSAAPSYQQKDLEFKATVDAAFTFQ